MKKARWLPLPVVLSVAGLLAAGFASAQMVPLSRCRAAYPCAFPFGMQWGPDPLVAGPYAQVPNTAISAHIDLKAPFRIELNRPLDQNALDEVVRKSLEFHKPAESTPALPKTVLPKS